MLVLDALIDSAAMEVQAKGGGGEEFSIQGPIHTLASATVYVNPGIAFRCPGRFIKHSCTVSCNKVRPFSLVICYLTPK